MRARELSLTDTGRLITIERPIGSVTGRLFTFTPTDVDLEFTRDNRFLKASTGPIDITVAIDADTHQMVTVTVGEHDPITIEQEGK